MVVEMGRMSDYDIRPKPQYLSSIMAVCQEETVPVSAGNHTTQM